MSINSCLAEIIGFSRSEDLCVDGWDPSFADSLSGIYIDEMEGMSLRILDSVGGKDSIWGMMDRARSAAINSFKTDIWAEILKSFEYRRDRFSGEIGNRRFTNVIFKDTYHGIRLFSDIKGGTFTLRGVTLNLNDTEAVSLLIYNDFELLDTINLVSSANKPAYNAITPVELELNGNYYFIIQPAGTPYNNKITCGCGGYKWCFNTEHPCYKGSKENWTLWCMAGGIHGTDIDKRDDWAVSQYAQGMRLHGDFKCDATDIFCSDASDFENNEVDSAVAWAIAFKTAEFLTYEIRNSGEVSRYTLLGNDAVLTANMSYYSERYSALLTFIGENIPVDANDCLQCRPSRGIGMYSQRL
jgi:hypothetical protein